MLTISKEQFDRLDLIAEQAVMDKLVVFLSGRPEIAAMSPLPDLELIALAAVRRCRNDGIRDGDDVARSAYLSTLLTQRGAVEPIDPCRHFRLEPMPASLLAIQSELVRILGGSEA